MEAGSVRPPAPHGASPEGPIGGAAGPFDFVPRGFDWRSAALDTVKKYPVPCIFVAAGVGFWIGRNRGRAVAAALAGVATNVIVKQLVRAIDPEHE